MNSKFANNSVDRGVSNGKENQTKQLADLQWVDAASHTHDPTRWDFTPLSS